MMTATSLVSDVKQRLTAWAKSVADDIGTAGVYLFGSLVYRGGAQFGPASDVDLVVCFPNDCNDELARWNWEKELHDRKVQLEADLATVLTGSDPKKPICSVVVPTALEIEADVHKDGARGFFKENAFLNLLDGSQTRGLPNAGSRPLKDRLTIEVLRFAQKKRNQFFAVNAGGEGGLAPYEGADAAPKDVMRYAAMAAHPNDSHAEPGAEYDTQAGLDFLSNRLYENRNKDAAFGELHHWLSIRRNARGEVGPLTPSAHLLFAEIIASVAIARLPARAPADPTLRGQHSTVWFDERFAQAFPGVRGVQWYDDAQQIKTRLCKLLEPPLAYAESEPAWWFRGQSNCPIRAFKHVQDDAYQMDVYEFRVRRIAAINLGQYFRDFVYVEAAALPPTGLYASTSERIAEEVSGNGLYGYYTEEYGIVDGTHHITRTQHDDGAAEIAGQLQDVRGRSELRVRYVSPYNFVIAANGSALNNPDFDEVLEQFLDAMLRGKDLLDQLAAVVQRLPKRHR
ncbi:nucleotidyltransferase domain-containing protein [Bradyrhizobium centrosematis]|uniref:nucleotidyltransferase domain-containing protein n=1 Tax=Bradyrhizobium centrosematis TaxID=1300039 RepID=UPI00388E9397